MDIITNFFNTFKYLVSVVVSFFEIVVGVIVDSVYVILSILSYIPTFLSYIFNVVDIVPDFFKPFIMVGIFLMLIHFIIRR